MFWIINAYDDLWLSYTEIKESLMSLKAKKYIKILTAVPTSGGDGIVKMDVWSDKNVPKKE